MELSKLVTMIKEDIQKTAFNILSHQHGCPFVIQAKQIVNAVIETTLDDYANSKTHLNEIVVKVYEELQETKQQLHSNIKAINDLTCNILIDACKAFMKKVQLPWKVSFPFIKVIFNFKQIHQKRIVQHVLFEVKKQEDTIKIYNNLVKYSKMILKYAESLCDHFNELFEIMIQELVEEKLDEKKLMKSLIDILKSQLERICYDFFDFAYIQDEKVNELFLTIKQTSFNIVMSFYTFIYKMSFFSIREMDNLNDILENNQALANIDSYKILQVDAALLIVEMTGQLLDRQYFFRPEFYHLRKAVVHHSLKHFYHLSESLHFHLHLPSRPSTFKEQLEMMNVKVIVPPPQNIQIINVNKNRDFQEVLENEKNLIYSEKIDQFAELNLYEKAKQVFVAYSQDAINKINKKVVIILQFQQPHDFCGKFIVQLGTDSSLIIKQLRCCDIFRIGAISSIESYENVNLVQFIQIATTILPYSKEFKEEQLRIKSLQTLERENTDGLSYLVRQNTRGLGENEIVQDVIEEEEEVHPDHDNFQNPIIHEKHIFLPKKPIKYGASAGYVTAKALGSGLGVLIVDCLDDEMTWDEKFQNAGCYGLYVGVIGFISARLPVVGLLIQEALLVYAVTITLNNKVVDQEEKMKNLGHLCVQITIGVGFTIAGSIFIPLHFWGAFIGAMIGGIGIGVYSKCVVPATMACLLDMIDELDRRISKEGCILYNSKIVEILKINEKFFEATKPKDLSDNDWLTLALVCLVNETHYMFQILAGKQIHKINEKLKKDSENPKLREEIKEIRLQWIDNDIRLFEWKVCRKYVVQRKLNILSHYRNIQEFVMGMLGNFKII